MIRLPPTSISLSESDIQLHFREISIYQSLLQQGFTRDAIQQYYASLRAAEPKGSPSSHSPPLVSTKIVGSDEESSVSREERPASSRYLNAYISLPTFPIKVSEEGVSIVTGRRQLQPRESAEAFLPKSTYIDSDSRRNIGGSKQVAYEEASGNEGHATTDNAFDVSEISSPRDAGSFAPSTVELRARARVGSRCFQPTYQEPSDDYREIVDEHSRSQGQGEDGADASDLHSSPLATNLNLPLQHRPRQSSMLHITRNAASPGSSAHSDDSFKSTVTKMLPTDTPELARSPRPRTMTYRARSQTYPWVQSEADDFGKSTQPVASDEGSPCSQSAHEELGSAETEVGQNSLDETNPRLGEVRPSSVTRIASSPAGTTITTSHRQISAASLLRADADDFVPLKLPSPFSATRRVSSGLNSLPSAIHSTSPVILQREVHARSSPNLAISPPPRSSSTGGITRHLDPCHVFSSDRDFPSSPPRFEDDERSESDPKKQASAIPTRRGREAVRPTQTHALPKTPRIQARTQQTDGPGTVYDDRIPAYLQPKTPADLTRGVHVTEREAAYTAPPGRTARTPATISQTLLSPTRLHDPGEESPSRRARTMRERRERELRRSAMMEEEIWVRLRELEGDPIGGRMHWDGPDHRLMNNWRDDFGADRLGEENFDEEGGIRTSRVELRVQGTVRGERRRGA